MGGRGGLERVFPDPDMASKWAEAGEALACLLWLGAALVGGSRILAEKVATVAVWLKLNATGRM